jgi:hypothetical protein
MTIHDSTNAPTAWSELPAAITTYLTAQANREDGTVLSTFTADAVVTDESRDFVGRDEIVAWLSGPASEYTYTTEFISATTVDTANFDIVQRLEGDFPGGVADLHYRFSMDGALIRRLVIEP